MSRLAFALCLLVSAPAAAQVTPTFHAEGTASVMLTESYRDRFDWGGGGAIRAGLELLGPLAVNVGFATAWFPVEGQEPGNLYAFTVGARGFFALDDGPVGGPFVDANLGLALTGDLSRFGFDLGVGWDFFPHPAFGVGPVVRYGQIVQPDDAANGDDAHLLTFGVNLTARIDLGASAPEAAPAPLDEDGDGVDDDRDRCPGEPEDVDGFQDDDGCIDADDDSDGFPDASDRCPRQAETRNGFEDEDGCPDEAPPPPPAPVVRERDEGELLSQAILFRSGSDRVSPRFREDVRAVCELAAAHPDARIRVIGHADEEGTAAANHRLGAMRAGAVAEQLVLCGVAPPRIESRSYGDTQPHCSGDGDSVDEECRAQNRRVIFRLLR